MINLRCTKKLLQHLGQKPAREEAEPTSALGDWFGNVVVGPMGPLFILITNERSLISVVLRPDADVLGEFRRRVIALLRRLDLPKPLIERETFHLQQICIAKTNNRRVLGSMNDASFQAEVGLFEARASVDEVEDGLAENLYAMVGYQRPVELLRELLGAPPEPERPRRWLSLVEPAAPSVHEEVDGAAPPSAALPDELTKPLTAEALTDRATLLLRKPIYQLRLGLVGVEPEVWRRVLVTGNITLGRLHEAIQVCMGWEDYHLHEFHLSDGQRFGRQGIEEFDDEVEDERRARLRRLLPEVGSELRYLYDFGDDWVHRVVVEAILTPQEAGRTPRCIDGARACPPEDVGGPGGYAHYLQALADPRHSEHRTMKEWGGPFDPAALDLEHVNRQLRRAFPSG